MLDCMERWGQVLRSGLALIAAATVVVGCGQGNEETLEVAEPSATATSEPTPLPSPTPQPTPTPTALPSPTPEPTPPPSPTPEPTATPGVSDVVLSDVGLGVTRVGDDPATTLASLTAIFGEPDFDTGWADPSVPNTEYLWPGCPGTRARIVAWPDAVGVLFTNWDVASPDGRATVDEPFFAGAGLQVNSQIPTAEGLRSGDRLAAAREVYADRLTISGPNQAVGLYAFAIDGTGSPLTRIGGIRGWVFWPDYPDGGQPDGPPTGEWQLRSIVAGVSCDTP